MNTMNHNYVVWSINDAGILDVCHTQSEAQQAYDRYVAEGEDPTDLVVELGCQGCDELVDECTCE